MSKLKALWAYVLAEPTMAAAFLTGVLPLLIIFHASWLTATQVGAIGAAIAAVLMMAVAFLTHHPALTVVMGALQAAVALVAAYGLHVSAQDEAIIVGVIGVIAHSFNWAGSGSRVLAPARPALGKGPYKPEESPVAPAPSTSHAGTVNLGVAVDTTAAHAALTALGDHAEQVGHKLRVASTPPVKAKPATKRAKKPTPAAD